MIDFFTKFLKNPVVFLFDLKKKWDMEDVYKKDIDPWGRNKNTEQVYSSIQLISDKKYERCLDVGTGMGYFAEHISILCNEVVAVDISEEAIVRAKERLGNSKNIQFLAGNIRDMEFQEKFNLIVLGEVLYYLGDTYIPDEFFQILKKFVNVLKSDGRILITHNVRPWRNEDWCSKKYIEQFETLGMILKKKEYFRKDKLFWIHVVLQK